jgi:uncharacterized protein YecE (DUF72 family)
MYHKKSLSNVNISFTKPSEIFDMIYLFLVMMRQLGHENLKNTIWYNYLYNKEELEPWAEKVEEIKKQTKILRAYFNNHYGGAAVINALQFKEMIGIKLSENERNTLEHAQEYLSNRQSTLPI